MVQVGAQANVADMEKQPFYTWIRDTYTYHVVAMAIALYALGGLPFLVWGLVRSAEGQERRPLTHTCTSFRCTNL